MAHILQSDDFFSDFFLGQFLPGDVFVLMVVWTVNTAVDTVIGQIQRCEHDDTVAVEVLFDLFRQAADFFGDFFVFAGQQHRGLSVADAFAQAALSRI